MVVLGCFDGECHTCAAYSFNEQGDKRMAEDLTEAFRRLDQIEFLLEQALLETLVDQRTLNRLDAGMRYQSLWLEAVAGDLCDLQDVLVRATEPSDDEDSELGSLRLVRPAARPAASGSLSSPSAIRPSAGATVLREGPSLTG